MRRLIVVFMAALALGSQGVARADTNGTISGSVSDGVTPVENVCVEASGSGSGAYGFAQTAVDGTYTIADLPADSYIVDFFDCRENPTFLTQWYNGKSSYEQADPIEVGDGASVTGIDASLVAGGFVTGTLTDTTGAPASTCVSAVDGSGNAAGWAYSDGDGRYRMGPVTTGEIRIVFAQCWYGGRAPVAGRSIIGVPPPSPVSHGYVPEWYDDAHDLESATPVPVVAPTETPGIDAVLALGAGITGTVRSEDGHPLSSICVDAVGDATSGYAQTDDTGFYSIDQLPAGEYRVGFYDCGTGDYQTEWYDNKPSFGTATAITLAEGGAADGIDAWLAKRPRPDFAVTKLRVANVPLRTDAATVPGPGVRRRVEVTVANLGTSDVPAWYGEQATLYVWVQMRSDGATTELGSEQFGLAPGHSHSWSYDWNATGSVGDADVHAALCVPDDSDPSNDSASARTYALVGGTGYGFEPLKARPTLDHLCQVLPVPAS